MTKKLCILGLCLLMSLPQLMAQFSLTGEIRPRSEYRHGFSSLIGPNEDAAFFISQRSRLNFGFNNTDVKVFVSLQDVRVWGDVPQLNRSDANSSIHEAWAEIPLHEQLALKVGRQEVIYDNTRIFGNVDWAQQGRSHDLALLKWNAAENLNIHGGLAFNQESERRVGTFYGMNNYKTMQYAWVNYQPGQTGISFLFMNLGNQHQPDETVFNQTMGAYVTHNLGDSRLEGAYYLQTGKDAANRDLKAWYLGAEASTPLSEQLTARAGFEWLSGTNMFGTETNRSFTPYFGTNHRFNGHMDYFYVGNHINNVGLRDFYLSTHYSNGPWMGMAALHGFWADASVYDPVNLLEQMDAYLGTELDLMLGYALNPGVALRFGYSHMFASETMERIKGGSKNEPQYWLWTMIVIKPKFI